MHNIKSAETENFTHLMESKKGHSIHNIPTHCATWAYNEQIQSTTITGQIFKNIPYKMVAKMCSKLKTVLIYVYHTASEDSGVTLRSGNLMWESNLSGLPTDQAHSQPKLAFCLCWLPVKYKEGEIHGEPVAQCHHSITVLAVLVGPQGHWQCCKVKVTAVTWSHHWGQPVTPCRGPTPQPVWCRACLINIRAAEGNTNRVAQSWLVGITVGIVTTVVL